MFGSPLRACYTKRVMNEQHEKQCFAQLKHKILAKKYAYVLEMKALHLRRASLISANKSTRL